MTGVPAMSWPKSAASDPPKFALMMDKGAPPVFSMVKVTGELEPPGTTVPKGKGPPLEKIMEVSLFMTILGSDDDDEAELADGLLVELVPPHEVSIMSNRIPGNMRASIDII